MKARFQLLFIMTGLIFLVLSCKPPTYYPPRFEDKIYTGKLSDTVYLALKKYLIATTHQQLRDTIIIKYEYNKETCWASSDSIYEDSFFINAAGRGEKYRLELSKNRIGASIFHFREPGNEINKTIKWDKTIIIDSTKVLFGLLFSKRNICGSSILIIPDQRYIFIKRDAHEDIIRLNPIYVSGFLEKKYTYERFYKYLLSIN